MKFKKRTIFRVIWGVFVLFFMGYLWSGFQAKNIDPNILKSSSAVKVTVTKDLISFQNPHSDSLGILFFPGGLTDPKAYTPLARTLAENGFTIHIIKMPWRLAQYGYEKIETLFNLDNPDIHYILAGHSQGAKMAAQYVYENPSKIDGLILLGTSHPRDFSLSEIAIPTLKLYAENDGLASTEEVLENKNKLPAHTELVLIKGGNHSQFGNLGYLLMDDEATITREDQQNQVVKYILNFLENEF